MPCLHFKNFFWAKKIKVNGETCIIWGEKEKLFWQTIWLRGKQLNSDGVWEKIRLYLQTTYNFIQHEFFFEKKPTWFPKMKAMYTCFVFFRTSCALSYKIYFYKNEVIFTKHYRAKSYRYVYVTNYLSRFLHWPFSMR